MNTGKFLLASELCAFSWSPTTQSAESADVARAEEQDFSKFNYLHHIWGLDRLSGFEKIGVDWCIRVSLSFPLRTASSSKEHLEEKEFIMADTASELASLDRLQDRIDSSSNEKLPDLLRVAVPALVKLVNKDELRARVFKMFGPLLKRLKNLQKCDLPLEALVSLVRQEHQPYACNFSMTFIDVAWERQLGKNEILTLALLESILEWPLYSPQSNALLAYTWYVIPYLSTAIQLHKEKAIVDRSMELKHILSDYLLDLCLVHNKSIKHGQQKRTCWF